MYTMLGGGAPGCAATSGTPPILLADNAKTKTMTRRANFMQESPPQSIIMLHRSDDHVVTAAQRRASAAPGSGTGQRLPQTNRAPRCRLQALVRRGIGRGLRLYDFSLSSILPIPRVPMEMRHRQDEDLFWVDAINEAIRKALQQIASIFVFIDRPQPWKFLNPAYSLPDFVKK